MYILFFEREVFAMDCIMVSSYPKSGTVLMQRIINRLTGGQELHLLIEKYLNSILGTSELSGAAKVTCAHGGLIRFESGDNLYVIIQLWNEEGIC